MRAVLVVALTLIAVGCTGTAPELRSEQPRAECQREPGQVASPLRCDAALAAAMRSLPFVHPAIDRIEFRYGFPCLPGSLAIKCRITQPVDAGFVLITYADASVAMVAVRANAVGEVTARQPQEWPAERPG